MSDGNKIKGLDIIFQEYKISLLKLIHSIFDNNKISLITNPLKVIAYVK